MHVLIFKKCGNESIIHLKFKLNTHYFLFQDFSPISILFFPIFVNCFRIHLYLFIADLQKISFSIWMNMYILTLITLFFTMCVFLVSSRYYFITLVIVLFAFLLLTLDWFLFLFGFMSIYSSAHVTTLLTYYHNPPFLCFCTIRNEIWREQSNSNPLSITYLLIFTPLSTLHVVTCLSFCFLTQPHLTNRFQFCKRTPENAITSGMQNDECVAYE